MMNIYLIGYYQHMVEWYHHHYHHHHHYNQYHHFYNYLYHYYNNDQVRFATQAEKKKAVLKAVKDFDNEDELDGILGIGYS